MQRTDERDDEPDFATRQELAASAEAGAIGGRSPKPAGVGDEQVDDAMRPVYEAGGGEQDGFELAERDLVRNASHDDGVAFPEGDGFTPERESDRASVEYAESDDAAPHDP
ncbi:MAG: hypothetical protein WKF42_03780 [Solirubrobacteraceae bacterium]